MRVTVRAVASVFVVIGDERRVVDFFCAWLQRRGWEVQREKAYVDVVAQRSGRRILAEANGRTTDPGLDIDTLYGQLLRRVPGDAIGRDTFAVVVPDTAVRFAERVSAPVRRVLNIHIYGVAVDGSVRHFGEESDPSI